MTRTIVSTEGLLSTGAMARQLGISANVLRDHLGDLALRDERRLYWWDEAKTRAAAARNASRLPS
jgi:predicted ArsR family transcriptional regulator